MAFLVARFASHAVLFLTEGDAWTPSPAAARRLAGHLQAERTRVRVAGDAVLPEAALPHLRGPILTVRTAPAAMAAAVG